MKADRVKQPDDFLTIRRPGYLPLICAAFALLLAFLIWFFAGRIPLIEKSVGIQKDGVLLGYLDMVNNLHTGQTVVIDDQVQGVITDVEPVPLSADEVLKRVESDYARSHLTLGNWNTCVVIKPEQSLSDGVHTLSIDLEDVSLARYFFK